MTSLFCNLIGAWKFLSGGPRILPKFTRSFSSREGGVWVRDYTMDSLASQPIYTQSVLVLARRACARVTVMSVCVFVTNLAQAYDMRATN